MALRDDVGEAVGRGVPEAVLPVVGGRARVGRPVTPGRREGAGAVRTEVPAVVERPAPVAVVGSAVRPDPPPLPAGGDVTSAGEVAPGDLGGTDTPVSPERTSSSTDPTVRNTAAAPPAATRSARRPPAAWVAGTGASRVWGRLREPGSRGSTP